jgi:phosphohistidine phosphatase
MPRMTEPRRLLLLRHAKSSWDDPTLDDHARPLAPRGRRAARLISKHLRDEGIEISLVLCSSARRAVETVGLVAPTGKLRIQPGLYAASSDELLERLQRVPPEAETVMLVGHNPSIQELATGLASGPSELDGQKFPTGALATLSFYGLWRELAFGEAELVSFVTPRQLG